MEELNAKIPLFKRIDRIVFEQIDRFKTTPNYHMLQDFYNSLEEDQQRIFKFFLIALLFAGPLFGIGMIAWGNSKLAQDLQIRTSIITKANEILGQKQSLRDVSPQILATNPIDSSSMMSSRLSNILSGAGVDLSKIQSTDFESNPLSTSIMKSEATFVFRNFTTDELMNTFTAMIQREKFRIESVNINRIAQSGLLEGSFRAIHFSSISQISESE